MTIHVFFKKYKELLIPVFSTTVLMGSFCYAAWFTRQYEIEMEKGAAFSELSVISSQVENLINRQIDKAQGLSVYYQETPNVTFDELTAFSEKLFASQSEILKTVVLTKDTTVTFIYPLKGNESVLGVDLTTVENQKDGVLQAKKSLRPVSTLPIELIQGGRGIIFRLPQTSYKEGISQNYVGLLNVVINYDRMLGNSGVLNATREYDINVYQISDDAQTFSKIFYTTEKPLGDPVSDYINVKNSKWLIEMVPINGWRSEKHFYVLVFLSGVLISTIVFFYLRSLLRSKTQLNLMVSERTQALSLSNESLKESLEDLKLAQDQLIRSEKLAGLGELVAGVAHEINTPLGVGITLTSFIIDKQNGLKLRYNQNVMTRKELVDYLRETSEALEVMDASLQRAAEIVRSFKNVAVDQSTLEIRTFMLSPFIHDILLSMTPKFKHTQHQIEINCPPTLEVTTYPGALSQILTQLINNSLTHGFEEIPSGIITITFEHIENSIVFKYDDNGIGIPLALQERIFNPFYTTKKSDGSTGLGLHIVHNLATQVLKGQIVLISDLGMGTHFEINFPIF